MRTLRQDARCKHVRAWGRDLTQEERARLAEELLDSVGERPPPEPSPA